MINFLIIEFKLMAETMELWFVIMSSYAPIINTDFFKKELTPK